MKLTFHGGFSEIGRSCIQVATKQTKLLLDAGTKLSPDGAEYPLLRNYQDINAIALSHAHLDHCGALPFYCHQGFQGQIFCTRMTKSLAKILLRDSYKVERLEQVRSLYDEDDVFHALDAMDFVDFRESFSYNDVKITFFDSGHIPGGSSILVETEGKRLLYTGDINTEDSNLMHGADINYGPIDILICEATYGNRDHPERMHEEQVFLHDIKHALSEGGSILVASLAVSRAQEMLLILGKEKFSVPVYLDGMAKKVLTRLLDQSKILRNSDALHNIAKRVRFVHGQKMRDDITRSPAIFVAPSGMLDGGPAMEYLKALWHDEKALIALTCYQGEGTNGRLLLEEGDIYIDGTKRHVQGKAKKYDFSSHIGMTPLHNYIKHVNPKILLLNHGDPTALEALAAWAKKEKIDVRVPKIGDELVV